MSKLVVPAGSVRNLDVNKQWFNLLASTHQFIIKMQGHATVVGAVGRQYDFGDINEIEIHNESENELRIEYEIADIHITSVADGNVKVTNQIEIGGIARPIKAKIDEEIKVLSRVESGQEINTLDDIIIQPHSKVLVIGANPKRGELLAKNTSANASTIRFGGEQVSNINGLPVVQNGVFGLSNGAAVYAHNASDNEAKVSVLEVML